MSVKTIKKSVTSSETVSVPSDIEKINRHTIVELKDEDVFTFKVRLCDNRVDRVGDKFSDEALKQISEMADGLSGLQNHDWSSDRQLCRLYDAELVTDDEEVNELGEPVKYVLGYAYTLSKYEDLIDKIKSGLLKEVSISFNSEGDTCSLNGKPMTKIEGDVAVDEDGHIAGQEYDGELCYNSINNVTDLLEWSLVAVPCQKNSGIKSKSVEEGGNGLMRKAELLIRKFMASKSFKSAPEEEQKTLESVVTEDNSDLTDEDIKSLIEENSSLKEKIKELEDRVAGFDAERKQDIIKGCVGKAFDGCGLITPEVKGLLEKELPWETFELAEDGQTVVGLDDAMAALKEQYKGLFKSEDPEVVDATKEKEVKTEEEEVKTEEEVKEPEEEKKETEVEVEVKKSLQRPSFMTFGSSANANIKSYDAPKRQGIYIS